MPLERRPRAISRAIAIGALGALALLNACASIPEGRSAIDEVQVTGAVELDDDDVKEKLSTTESPKFLGLFRGVVYEYEVFDHFALQRDLARVERFYHSKGFYAAHARAGRFMTTKANHLRVEIVVEEGEPVLNDELKIEGLDGLPPAIVAAVRAAAGEQLIKGERFQEDTYAAAETTARRALTDRAYAYAKVTREVRIDIVHHRANTVLTVTPDRPAKFGKVTIQGRDIGAEGPSRQEIPEPPMRRAIDIKEGDPYSTAAIDAATQALLDLEVFSAVEVVPELPEPPPESRIIPLVVKVEPSRLRQVRFGGGFEFDQIKTDLHALAGWEDHNFLGGLRDFTVELKPGVVLYPMRLTNIVVPEALLPEEKFRVQLRQPGFIEARTNGFIRTEFNTFPLLVKPKPDPDDPVIGYAEFKGAAGVDRTYRRFFAGLAQNLQVEQPFAYKGTVDPDLALLVISYPELVAQLDLRNDRIHPHKGIYLGTSFQFAGGGAFNKGSLPFGGNASDIKIQGEIRTYVPIAKTVTFATRMAAGVLYATNYGDVVQNHLSDPITPGNRADRVRDIQTVFFRGFFSGGSSSNRGYPIRGISPHGIVPFLNPATALQQASLNCEPSLANNFNPPAEACSIPVGGFTLWELSNELRFSVTGPFSAATFCDMSDVSATPGDFRFGHLHLSCGLGVRYETPVGPIRLDIGYRVQPLQVLGQKDEAAALKADPTEGYVKPLFGFPVAVAFGIGEAF